MRGFNRLTRSPLTATSRQSLLASSTTSSFSSSSAPGGRGRGRGLASPTPPPSTAPGQPPHPDDCPDAPIPSGLGHGRGRGAHPPLPSSAGLPSFASLMASMDTPAGRGRGLSRQFQPSASPHVTVSEQKNPTFFRSEEASASVVKGESGNASGPVTSPPFNFSFGNGGAGRGKETKLGENVPRPPVDNRHLRQREAAVPANRGGRGGRGGGRFPQRIGQEGFGERGGGMQQAEGGRGRGFSGERGGRGRGGREVYARGGRGGRFARLRPHEEDETKGLYLGDDADGERLTKRFGEENVMEMREMLDETIDTVLPSPELDAFEDAQKVNFRIEFEPEYLMEFNNNPDIDEKPPISLQEALEKMKPFLMEYEGIQSEEEWEEIMKDVMERAPYLKKVVDEYSGPDRVTAKQQQQELNRVAKTLPENIPSSVKRFTDRALLSLQSNPGWGFDKKWKFMDKLAYQLTQHYK